MIRSFTVTRFFLPLAAVAISVAVGCSSAPKPSTSGAPSLSGTDEQIFIGDTIEKNYDPNVIMKRAEAFFEKEEYPEAIIEYQHFLDLHRVHVLAPYAQFKLGESHFKMVKTVDRDPDPVYKALEAFEKLQKDYSGSRYDSEAAEKIRQCHNMIARAHLFVGQFYYRRDAYLAAARRFELILNQYPEMDVAADAVYHLAVTYSDLGADEWARETLAMLAERYPDNKFKSESKQLLAALNAKQPAQAVALSGVSPNGTSANGLSGTNGAQPPPPSQPVISPVTALRNPAVASPTPQMTLCRLGVWC